MAVSRPISPHRSKLIFASILLLSVISLASGSRGRVVADSVRTVVGVVSLPVLFAFNRIEDGYNYATGIVFDYSAARETADALTVDLGRMQQRVSMASELETENRRLRRLLSRRKPCSEPRGGSRASGAAGSRPARGRRWNFPRKAARAATAPATASTASSSSRTTASSSAASRPRARPAPPR